MYYRLWLGSGIRPPRTIPLGPSLFLYALAFVVAHTMKHELFNGTAIESFTMDSFIKRII